uniref:Secreted protein n=1 Tax=Oryza barthii TaxID=65489 RepID=A0A0D3GZ41_9ORYZ
MLTSPVLLLLIEVFLLALAKGNILLEVMTYDVTTSNKYRYPPSLHLIAAGGCTIARTVGHGLILTPQGSNG